MSEAGVLSRSLTWLGTSSLRVLSLGLGFALVVATLVTIWLMKPPLAELADLVRALAITSVLSLGLGVLIYRRGLARSPSLMLTLAVAYSWAALLTLINVLVMAELMFLDDHDLALSIVLVIFAAILAITYGIFVSASVTDGLRDLAATAREVAAGDLEARVEVVGRDEVAEVAETFNAMTAQLQQAAERRAGVEKMRRDLVAWTSHDLRTPLTGIRAMIEALNDGIVDDEETVQRYYRTINADIIALNTLIDDLFELAQLEAGGLTMEMGTHSLADLISDALEMFQVLAAQRDIALSGEVGEGLTEVQMNPARVSRVLSNLIANALKYAPEGGAIWVRATGVGDEAHVVVQDNGPGFAEADLPRVFEQFYRGESARSRSKGGGGLGLAIANAIVEAHDGHMWAENVAGGGAQVGFVLPCTQEQERTEKRDL